MTGTPESPNDNDHFHQTPQPNELGKALNKGLAKAEPYYHLILAVVVAAVVVTGGYVLWMRSAEAQKKLGWDEFALCRAPDDYLAVADKYPNLPVGQWSRLHAARQFLGEGLGQSLTNREASDERLNKAKSSYESILKQKVKPELREEALYGLATTLEALSDGDPKEAIKAYEQLLNDYPESQHRLWARERVDALKTSNAETFYAWFRKQNPKPADRPSPLDIPSNPPEDVFKELQLPAGSESSQTSTPPAGEMKIELPKPDGDAPKSFPEGEEKANMPAPSEQKKPLEVPAEQEKPMTEKAPEKPAEKAPETKKPEAEKADAPKPESNPDATPPKGDAEE
ncbi:MAG TPA: tetratricopeptide repeat protein [Planctomicrobium sp.]|nr:tetratricopeptide repeat protein [Planctomicrobium sp.]